MTQWQQYLDDSQRRLIAPTQCDHATPLASRRFIRAADDPDHRERAPQQVPRTSFYHQLGPLTETRNRAVIQSSVRPDSVREGQDSTARHHAEPPVESSTINSRSMDDHSRMSQMPLASRAHTRSILEQNSHATRNDNHGPFVTSEISSPHALPHLRAGRTVRNQTSEVNTASVDRPRSRHSTDRDLGRGDVEHTPRRQHAGADSSSYARATYPRQATRTQVTRPEPAPTSEDTSHHTRFKIEPEQECPICIETLEDGSSLVKCTTCCRQIFHLECLAVWLETQHQQDYPPTCPHW